MYTHQEIVDKAFKAFNSDASSFPPMTLRGGNQVDEYSRPESFNELLDKISDEYLQNHYWGIAHLDAASWRHYLPSLIEYSLRNFADAGSMVIDGFLFSLRPPDREPPRLATLNSIQKEVIVAFLDVLAFDEGSAWKENALQVLEEYWIPKALYRKRI